MRRSFIGGNWKCYGTKKSIEEIVTILNSWNNKSEIVDIVCAPSFIHLDYVSECLRSDFDIAIQNIWEAPTQGAYTGEITVDMIKDFDVKWAIIGHSERRHKVANESNKLLFNKVLTALNAGINVIYCIGETLEEREYNKTYLICKKQLDLLITNLRKDQWKNIVIAYEPVWAIGTGKTAAPDQVELVHSYIRDLLKYIDNSVRIIYGGSVKPDNAKILIQQPNIDGFLVGGCSLKYDFLEIINCTL